MTPDLQSRGGAPVAMLTALDPWEAILLLNIRLWCEGPEGQSQVLAEYRRTLPDAEACRACKTFERLVLGVIDGATRPLVRHAVGCACVGSDEAIFLNLVRTAADGHLGDAALIATLLIGPAHAEHMALMAGEVGHSARQIQRSLHALSHQSAPKAARLH